MISMLLRMTGLGLLIALWNEDKLTFHYVSGSIRPDLIEVWMGDRHVYTYAWISGEDAYRKSKLGRLHAIYGRHNGAR